MNAGTTHMNTGRRAGGHVTFSELWKIQLPPYHLNDTRHKKTDLKVCFLVTHLK